MSYKSLLFCPDEKTARVVTQVLSELEFTVELSGEPFATVKKLTDEHFDALVVDCQNEQDASLLFKAARNSSLNHSSLSVAVVEGQAGVAKAFRIGANLVLSKPVNVEQSKSTLRVARGLLRKNSEARAAASVEGGATAARPAAPAATSPVSSAMLPSKSFAFDPGATSGGSPAASGMTMSAPAAPSKPYAALEQEKEPTPAPEPSDAALLESMPNPIDGKPTPVVEAMWAPKSQGQAQPIAASTGGQGAATAPALAKTTERKMTGLSPMVTHEPIVAEADATEHFPVAAVPVPTFSMDLDKRGSNSGGGKAIKTVAMVVLFGVAGYLAWQRLQPLQYLPGSPSVQPVKQPPAAPEATPTRSHSTQSPTANADNSSPDVTSSSAPPETTTGAAPLTTTSAASDGSQRSAPQNIQVQEMPMNSEQRVRLAAKPQPNVAQSNITQPGIDQPIVVKPNPGQTKPGSPAAQPQQPTPPALTLSTTGNSGAALANIVSTEAAKPTLGSFRVSQGVSQGLLIKKVAPSYSPTALQLRKEGAVDLIATISKEGSVTKVKVLKGDLMLANSAVEAVKQWKYRPYLLNGEPVEIETQITVNFRLPQ